MIACEKKNLEVIPPYKIVVIRTYILIFLTHCPPPLGRGGEGGEGARLSYTFPTPNGVGHQ
jgi:hypothetical protein